MNPWITHLKAFYAKHKSQMTYGEAMKKAKATYKKKGPQKGKGVGRFTLMPVPEGTFSQYKGRIKGSEKKMRTF